MTHVPPPAAAVSHLKASNAVGLVVVAATTLVTAAGVWLSVLGPVPAWLLGQLAVAAAMVEWFVVLHECGHRTLFRGRAGNAIAGRVAGAWTLIPFRVWTHVHRQHHTWTGWQDLDPTTAALAPRRRRAIELRIVRVCWKYWIPLFALVYRLGNFWNPDRLRQAPSLRVRRQLGLSMAALAAFYAAVAWWLGPLLVIRVFGLATLFAFAVEEVLLLSQHTHVPMAVSHGRRVSPHRAIDQERFTRSLRLPGKVSRLALHFDAHELHHMYPFVPGYRLRAIAYQPAGEVGWWQWLRAARACPGDTLLFQNRHQTGFLL